MGLERAVLPSVGPFGNRAPQEEGGGFKVGGLPYGLLNVFNFDSSVLLILLMLRLGITTLLWEDIRFRENWGVGWGWEGEETSCTYTGDIFGFQPDA